MKTNVSSISTGRAMGARTPVLGLVLSAPLARKSPGRALSPRRPIETHPFTPEQIAEIGDRFLRRGHSVTKIVAYLRRQQSMAEAGNNRIEDLLRYIVWTEIGRRKADRVAAAQVKAVAA